MKPKSGRRRGSTEESGIKKEKVFDKEAWKALTDMGKKVKSGEIKKLDEILDKGQTILETQIVEMLLPQLETDLLAIGQSKGKFGGGKASIWKQTQKKSCEGNKPSFSTLAVAGNRNGYIGIGLGKSKETVPAREKATRRAKLSIIKIRRGCGAWACDCGTPHSIPAKVTGKKGSVEVTLIPAPKGTGICTEKEMKKILELAGIKDVYCKTKGHTATKLNLLSACFEALKKLSKLKINEGYTKKAGVIGGAKE
ncbi:MAG: 30S ribosomal protein S5 [archaeon]